jgi:hypothetical protein
LSAGTAPNLSSPRVFPPQAAAVRRTDVMLRAAYPQLETRIFQLSPFGYWIVFDRSVLRADQIRNEFENSIRPITLQVEVSNEVPANFLREISPISDHELARGFAGLPLTRDDIRTILSGKFPKLPELISVGNAKHPILTLWFARELTADEQGMVRTFFDQWESGWPIECAVIAPKTDSHARAPAIPGEILRFRPARTRPTAPRFVQEDEAFWFDSVRAIFEGAIGPSSIFEVEGAGMSCYLDASAFRQVDLRQTVICYDTVFMSPPLTDGTPPSFWESQTLKRDDLLELVASDRLRFVLRQPEERTDLEFLNAVYEANPAALIGRRKAAALLAADLVQTADEYRFNQNGISAHIPEIASHLEPELRMPAQEIVQLLLWPNAARRACLLPLMSTGLMSLGNFGQGRLLGEQLQRITRRDIRLEALVTSDGVHIAHTLHATLIPPLEEMNGWILPRRVIGDRLNFYRSFNTRIAAAWAANERRREEKIKVLPPIPVFKFDRHAKVRDLIGATSYQSTRRKGRALLARLSELPPEGRQAEIDRLSAELYELGVRKERRMMFLDTMDNAKDVGAAILDFTLLPVRSTWGLVRTILSIARRIPAIDAFMDDLEYDLTPQPFRNEDLDFLSKIERVAELREPD